MRARSILWTLILALGLAFPALAAERPAEIHLFAAASLSDALEEIAAAYERQSGDRVVLNLGASSILARQIEEGAPADVFFSADEARMDALEGLNLILVDTRRSLLSNTLVVVVPVDSVLKIRSAKDLAAREVESLALAEPRSVPAGIYAREYLRSRGLWEAVNGKVIPTENVRGALAAVESGNVSAGIVYRTDAGISKKVKVVFEVPASQGPKISYSAAVLAQSRRQEAARKLLAYLESRPAVAIFRKHGFLVRR
jgi:molybdate transport system substrate-binding protein